MKNVTNDKDAITNAVTTYFTGTYHADSEQIRDVFHPEAVITGILNGQFCHWSLNDFIARITSVPSAAKNNEIYDKVIHLIDYTGDVAMVKARVVAAGHVFTDYITLLKIDKKWVIRNKSFFA